MKTDDPLILTPRFADRDIEYFDRLRSAYFPSARNFLRAHLTMFHRLPGEYGEQIGATLDAEVPRSGTFAIDVSAPRHLGAGVAFTVTSEQLSSVRARLKSAFLSWLGPQDLQKWQPHITVQNKVSSAAADALYVSLSTGFEPRSVEVLGLDLWRYLGGPWEHRMFYPFDEG